jgi:predicted Zn-dependent protease
MKMRSQTLSRLFILSLFGVFLLAPIGCTTNPATGKKSFTLYSWEWEKQAGASAAAGLAEQFGGEVDEVIASQYVRDVGMKLVTGIESGVPDLDWEFTLLNTEVINAFALPGGKVYFTRGLAEKLDSEAEMAGVLGHEIGHVTARHGNQRISKQIGFNVLLAGAAVAVGTSGSDSEMRKYGQVAVPALAIGGNVVLLKYGRDDESEADMLGMRYMERAGYNPIGQLRVMEVLLASAGGSRQPEWLSTHPHPESRIEDIHGYLAGQYAYTQNNPAYVMNEQEYEQRMLLPMRDLPPPPKAEETSLLDTPTLWCAHCQVASVE